MSSPCPAPTVARLTTIFTASGTRLAYDLGPADASQRVLLEALTKLCGEQLFVDQTNIDVYLVVEPTSESTPERPLDGTDARRA